MSDALIRIEHIEDVLAEIDTDNGIIVSERPDYKVIDYVYTNDDTFNSSMARQCRGLKFDAEGRIIARPFHKFFNIGEKQQPHEIDWQAPHHILDKLDGSMVHGVLLNGELLLMTRMGLMDQARAARSKAEPSVLELSQALLEAGITPIFEYTAPDNRIVVAYDDTRLTLLAAREMVSGAYLPYAELAKLGQRHGVPVVDNVGRVDDHKRFIDEARGLEGIEGYVIAFEDGHRVKLKTDGYALRHKMLSSVTLEKNVFALVVEKAVDDVVPLLAPEVGTRVREFEQELNAGIARRYQEVEAFFMAHKELERRDFAAAAFKSLDKRLTGVAFAMLDGKDGREFLYDQLRRACKSGTTVDGLRDLYGFAWSTEGLLLPEGAG